MQKSYLLASLCIFLCIGTKQLNAQSIVFSSDPTDVSKVVTEFGVDDKVYLHITTEKPLNETILLDDYYNIPRTMKCTSCHFYVNMRIAGTKDYYSSIWNPEKKHMSSELDYASNKLVIPLLPLTRIGKTQFVKFYDGLESGKTKIEVQISMHSGGRYALRKKKRPTATIEFNKTNEDVVSYGATFEDNYEAGKSDQDLEKKVVQSLNDRLKDKETSYVWKAAKIASKDWNVVRDRYNGAVLGREILCYCYAVESDGRCKVYQYYFIQEFDGVNYFESIHYYRSLDYGRGEFVDCTIE